jgi:hypothetical protein
LRVVDIVWEFLLFSFASVETTDTTSQSATNDDSEDGNYVKTQKSCLKSHHEIVFAFFIAAVLQIQLNIFRIDVGF